MRASLPATQPALRIAEEYAMLDAISGGRLIAGMPLVCKEQWAGLPAASFELRAEH